MHFITSTLFEIEQGRIVYQSSASISGKNQVFVGYP